MRSDIVMDVTCRCKNHTCTSKWSDESEGLPEYLRLLRDCAHNEGMYAKECELCSRQSWAKGNQYHCSAFKADYKCENFVA